MTEDDRASLDINFEESRFHNDGAERRLCKDTERFQTKTTEGALFFVAAALFVLLSVLEVRLCHSQTGPIISFRRNHCWAGLSLIDSQSLLTPHAVHYSFVKFEWYCGKNEERRSRAEYEQQPLHIFSRFCYKPLPFGWLSMGRLIFMKEASEGFCVPVLPRLDD
jgi:hypothetical protein